MSGDLLFMDLAYSVSNFPSASLGGDLFHFTLQDKDMQKDEYASLLDYQTIAIADPNKSLLP